MIGGLNGTETQPPSATVLFGSRPLGMQFCEVVLWQRESMLKVPDVEMSLSETRRKRLDKIP